MSSRRRDDNARIGFLPVVCCRAWLSCRSKGRRPVLLCPGIRRPGVRRRYPGARKFPRPPDFQSIAKGDKPETVLVLKPDDPACVHAQAEPPQLSRKGAYGSGNCMIMQVRSCRSEFSSRPENLSAALRTARHGGPSGGGLRGAQRRPSQCRRPRPQSRSGCSPSC